MPLPPTPSFSAIFGTSNVAGDDSTHMRLANRMLLDDAGFIYILENAASSTSRIRKIGQTGSETTVVTGNATYNVGNGWITDFCVSPSGDIYFLSQVEKIFKVSGGSTTVIAGTGTAGTTDGPISTATVNSAISWGMVYLSGDIYHFEVDISGSKIRKITSSAISTIATPSALTRYPTVGVDGNIYCMIGYTGGAGDTYIAQITPSGSVNAMFTPTPAAINTAGSFGLTSPTEEILSSFAMDTDGNFYLPYNIRDTSGGSYWLILKSTPSGTFSVLCAWSSASGQPGRPDHVSADSDGDLVVCLGPGVAGSTLGYTIQQILGVFTPPPTNPALSTLTDGFSSKNTAKWTFDGPAAIASGRLELGNGDSPPGVTGLITSKPSDTDGNNYYFDSALLQVYHAGYGMILMVTDADSSDNVGIQIDPDGWKIRAVWMIGGVGGTGGGFDGDGEDYDIDLHKWIRITRFTDTNSVNFAYSSDGLLWETLADASLTSTALRNAQAYVEGHLWTSIDNFNIAVTAPPDDVIPPPDLGDPGDPGTDWPVDPIQLPDAAAPGFPDAGSATVLELIRQFSSETRCIVRLTSSTSIEIVNPNHLLPSGMTQSDAADMYWNTHRSVQAGIKTLSLQDNKLALSADAQTGTDDVRVIASNWEMPNQLPVYGLRPAPVLSWSWSFTPDNFTQSFQFWFPVPLSIVRRS